MRLQISASRFRQFRGGGSTTAHHVGSQVVGCRDAVHRAGVFAIDQYDALVTMLDVGQKFLNHPLLAEGAGEKIVKGSEIEILAFEPKHRFAAFAIEGLHHDVAVLRPKRFDLGEVARNQCRWHQIGKFRDEHLLGCVADVCRVIDDQGLRVDAFKQVRGRHIGEIKGRILAQQHDVKFGKCDPPCLV